MLQIETIIGSEFCAKVIPFINSAKKSIKIVVFDWRWYYAEPGNPAQQFNHAILTAKNRGVEVKVVTNLKKIIDLLIDQGCKAKHCETEKLIHAKILIVDDQHLVIGSHNYTLAAFTKNYEVSVIIRDFDGIGPVLDFFNSLFL